MSAPLPSTARVLLRAASLLALVGALLSGALDIHAGGEPLTAVAGTWTQSPQLDGCAGPQSRHVDAGGPLQQHHCPACLHRLQTRGSALAPVPTLAVAPVSAALVPAAVVLDGDGPPRAWSARGPPRLLLG